MHPNPKDALAPPSAPGANRMRGAERLVALASGPEPWSVVRQVHTQGSQYLETHVAPFGPYPMHAHAAPGIALLVRGALEVTYASGHRVSGDASERAGALVLPVGTPHRGRAGSRAHARARVGPRRLNGTGRLGGARAAGVGASGPPPPWLRACEKPSTTATRSARFESVT